MSFLTFQFKNMMFLIKKRKFVSLLMVFFIMTGLLIFGKMIDLSGEAKTKAKKYEETYGNITLYRTGEALSDSVYQSYMGKDGAGIYDRLYALEESLRNATDIMFVENTVQPIEIVKPSIPDLFLDSYEMGDADFSVQEYRNETRYLTKALQVSQSFFEAFQIQLSSGQPFQEDDYLYVEDRPIPVLLGAEYAEIFQLGAVLEGYYLSEEKLKFQVQGFLQEDAFFYMSGVNDMVSCGRYIVMPAFSFETPTAQAKMALLQKLCGIVFSSCGYEETITAFEAYKHAAKAERLNIYITYPKAAGDGTSIFEKYAAMTKEVVRQFLIMVLIVMLFGSIAVAVTIRGMLRDNRQMFGVEMLCGASKQDVFAAAILFLASLLLCGDVLCSLLLLIGGATVHALLLVQLMTAGIFFLTGAITAVFVANMPLHDIIGGNE